MVTVTTNVDTSQHDEVVSKIQEVFANTSSITPRTGRRLREALLAGNLAVAFEGGELVGWLLAIPYSKTVHELGMAYVQPSGRKRGVLNLLTAELIERSSVVLTVTYERSFADSLMRHWGFVDSSLFEFALLSRGAFIGSRFRSLSSIKSVFTHVADSKPIYLIKKAEA